MKQRLYIALAALGILGLLFFIILWKGLQPKISIYVCDVENARWSVTVNSITIAEPQFDETHPVGKCQLTQLPKTIAEADITFHRSFEDGTLQTSQHVDFAKTTYIYAHQRDHKLWVTTSKQFVPSLADQ